MRKIAVLLAFVMLLSSLAGCGSEEVTETTFDNVATEEPSQASANVPETTALSLGEIDTSSYYRGVSDEQSDALTPIVREAIAQGMDADRLYSDYLGEIAFMGNGTAYQKTERRMSGDSITIRTAIINEQAINSAELPADADLEALVLAQYTYYEENGSIDTTSTPTYQVVGLAINGSYVKAEFALKINGVEVGSYTLDNNALLLPLSSEEFPADKSVEIVLTAVSGHLPTPDYIYVGLHSTLPGA